MALPAVPPCRGPAPSSAAPQRGRAAGQSCRAASLRALAGPRFYFAPWPGSLALTSAAMLP